MPVSLGRKIRRFGIPVKGLRSEEWTPNPYTVEGAEVVAELRQLHKRNRLLARDKQQSPAKEHRRSKSRRKAAREEKVVTKGKK